MRPSSNGTPEASEKPSAAELLESGTEITLIDAIAELGKAARDGAGWHVCLDQLTYHLDGAEPPWTQPDHWREVIDSYVEGFGPEAATIGPPDELGEEYLEANG